MFACYYRLPNAQNEPGLVDNSEQTTSSSLAARTATFRRTPRLRPVFRRAYSGFSRRPSGGELGQQREHRWLGQQCERERS